MGKNRNWDQYIFILRRVFTAVWLWSCDSWMEKLDANVLEELDANVLLQLPDSLVSVRQGSRMMNFNVCCSH